MGEYQQQKHTQHAPSMKTECDYLYGWIKKRNVTTSMDGLKNGHILKNLTDNGEPQRYSWGTQKKQRNCGTQKKKAAI